MADQGEKSSAGVSLAGKWQFPLLLAAVAVFAVGAIVHTLSDPGFDWDAAYNNLAYRVEHVTDGDYSQLAVETRMMMTEEYTAPEDKQKLIKLHMLLGEIHWRVIKASTAPNADHWQALKEDYLNAIAYGQDRTALIAERMAAVYLGLNDPAGAVRQYQQAIEFNPDKHLVYLRKIISIRRELLGASSSELLDDYLACLDLDNITPDEYGWAIDQAVGLLLEDQRMQEAATLVDTQQSRLLGEAYYRHLLYQRARVLIARGLEEQADNLLISLGEIIPDNTDLYLKARLLRADLIWDENPGEAEGIFREVIDRGSDLPLAPAAMVGLGRTLAHRGLYDQALSEFDNAIEKLSSRSDEGWVDPAMLSQRLSEVYEKLMDSGRSDLALRFAISQRRLNQVLSRPVDVYRQMENARRIVAARMAESEKARLEYLKALEEGAGSELLDVLLSRWKDRCEADGNDLIALSELAATLDDKLYGDSLWQAATAYIKADNKDKAISVLERFISVRPEDPRLPEARYLMGVLLKRVGRYEEAISIFRANMGTPNVPSRHVKTIEGLVPLAQCFIAQGPEHFGEAEKVLSRITNDLDGVTPESQLYLRALFALGDLYYRQQQWRQARVVLDEAIQRDSGMIVPAGRPDPKQKRARYIRASRAMYLEADSYLQSARKALSESADVGILDRENIRQRARTQLSEAASLFSQIIDRYDAMDEQLEDIDQIIVRNSCFSRADCMFEMAQYDRAIELYESAVRRNRRSREALGGLTNIYNCYMELGQLEKANATMERAARLRKVMQQEDYNFIDPEVALQQWDRWLDTVEYLKPAPAGQEAS